MNRPLYVWLAFAVSVAAVLAGLTAVTRVALDLERAERTMRREAIREEAVRLALWRLDSALAPIVSTEYAWPFLRPADTPGVEPAHPGVPLAPYVRGRFQIDADGGFRSLGAVSEEAQAAFRREVGPERIREVLSRQRLTSGWLQGRGQLRADEHSDYPDLADWETRNQTINHTVTAARSNHAQTVPHDAAAAPIDIGIAPIWVDDLLILAHSPAPGGESGPIQGSWFDWPALRKSLLETIHDILPNAELEPVRQLTHDHDRLLAALPVRVIPGEMAGTRQGFSPPVRLALVLAWVCSLLAVLAVGVLLGMALSLSERRATFVSAVTHEMRTPLTTFRLYSDMLAEGMVQDSAKRQRYYETLRAEAERLGHLVENVLAFARLERGRPPKRIALQPLRQALNAAMEPLRLRATLAERELVVDHTDGALDRTVRADGAALERILMNLVDNACKHGRPAADPEIRLVVAANCDTVRIRVCDRGPGISREDARRLFRPFGRSANEAAAAAPGVGLGLALSRRLARRLGGDLHHDTSAQDGTCFVLTLPIEKP